MYDRIIFILVLINLSIVFSLRFDGFKSVDIKTNSSRHIEFLISFTDKAVEKDENSFQISRITRQNEYIIISCICSDSVFKSLVKFLKNKSIKYEIIIKDFQKLIDVETNENNKARFKKMLRSFGNMDHTNYMRYDEMVSWINRKISRLNYAKFEIIGESYEKRNMFMIKISKNTSLPIVWLDGGIHAREWIASSSVLYVFDNLISQTDDATQLLNNYQFWIMPLVNPDGYEYSHQTHRLWRKNRRRYENSRCVGVDMNRNFPYKWGEGSNFPTSKYCFDQFPGISPGSEPEVKSIIQTMTKARHQIKLVVSTHSFGQYILQPFSYSESHYPENYLDMTSVGLRAAFDVYNEHQEHYLVGRPPDILYNANGSSDDFVVGQLGIPFSFTIELPDKGQHGFVLPPKYIKNVGAQFWTIIKSFANEVKSSL